MTLTSLTPNSIYAKTKNQSRFEKHQEDLNTRLFLLAKYFDKESLRSPNKRHGFCITATVEQVSDSLGVSTWIARDALDRFVEAGYAKTGFFGRHYTVMRRGKLKNRQYRGLSYIFDKPLSSLIKRLYNKLDISTRKKFFPRKKDEKTHHKWHILRKTTYKVNSSLSISNLEEEKHETCSSDFSETFVKKSFIKNSKEEFMYRLAWIPYWDRRVLWENVVKENQRLLDKNGPYSGVRDFVRWGASVHRVPFEQRAEILKKQQEVAAIQDAEHEARKKRDHVLYGRSDAASREVREEREVINNFMYNYYELDKSEELNSTNYEIAEDPLDTIRSSIAMTPWQPGMGFTYCWTTHQWT